MAILGGIEFNAMSFLSTPIFWTFLFGIMIILTFGMLWYRKQQKLIYSCMVVTSLGNGKIDIKGMKCGWFKTHTRFFGLYDYGDDEELRTGGWKKPEDKIQGASMEDFQDIFGKKGLICRRKGDDPRVLVPIPKVEMQNDKLFLELASVDLRDVSIGIIKQAERETRDRTAEIVQWVLLGGIIILLMITIIMTYQFITKIHESAWDKQLEAQRIVASVTPSPAGVP